MKSSPETPTVLAGPDQRIMAHGGELRPLLVAAPRAGELREQSQTWASWSLDARQLCDLELLLNGAFSPLQGYLCAKDYESVCGSMRLAGGLLWPIPLTLDVTEEFASALKPEQPVALRDPEGVMLAVLRVQEVWQPQLAREAEAVFGTADPEHPGVARFLHETKPWYVGGGVEGVQLPTHYDFQQLRRTPQQLRAEFAREGWRRVVAFQTRSPMHRVHFELTLQAAERSHANLLIHPAVGPTMEGDVDPFTRVRCYQRVMPRYPQGMARLSLLPLAMRMAGPREALWHAIIRKNYGCTHMIVGDDHAGPGAAAPKSFYGPYQAQELLAQHEAELGISMVPFRKMEYLPQQDRFVAENEAPKGAQTVALSGAQLRERLGRGQEVPEWASFPEVLQELRRSYPPRYRQGLTVFLTGLSGSGKSTLGNILKFKFMELGGRPVTLLDGDVVRKHLSSELGFSREHRDLNIRRIGFVASEITKSGGVAICAPIAPYDAIRKEVRRMVEAVGGFVLVHVATPLEICERRDRKGLYAKARAGLVKEFTGISDPYEEPADAEVVIDTTDLMPEQAAQSIMRYLEKEGLIRVDGESG